MDSCSRVAISMIQIVTAVVCRQGFDESERLFGNRREHIRNKTQTKRLEFMNRLKVFWIFLVNHDIGINTCIIFGPKGEPAGLVICRISSIVLSHHSKKQLKYVLYEHLTSHMSPLDNITAAMGHHQVITAEFNSNRQAMSSQSSLDRSISARPFHEAVPARSNSDQQITSKMESPSRTMVAPILPQHFHFTRHSDDRASKVESCPRRSTAITPLQSLSYTQHEESRSSKTDLPNQDSSLGTALQQSLYDKFYGNGRFSNLKKLHQDNALSSFQHHNLSSTHTHVASKSQALEYQYDALPGVRHKTAAGPNISVVNPQAQRYSLAVSRQDASTSLWENNSTFKTTFCTIKEIVEGGKLKLRCFSTQRGY